MQKLRLPPCRPNQSVHFNKTDYLVIHVQVQFWSTQPGLSHCHWVFCWQLWLMYFLFNWVKICGLLHLRSWATSWFCLLKWSCKLEVTRSAPFLWALTLCLGLPRLFRIWRTQSSLILLNFLQQPSGCLRARCWVFTSCKKLSSLLVNVISLY